jgi:hypothetical protein
MKKGKKKKEVPLMKFVCEKCGNVQKPDKKESNENWKFIRMFLVKNVVENLNHNL